MLITQKTQDALKRWIAPDTWYKKDISDEERFYHFVKELWEDIKKLPNYIEDQAIEEIMTREVDELHSEFLKLKENKQYIRDFLYRTRDILDFLNTTRVR